MLGAFSRWLALECSSLPHGGWACLFGCFLLQHACARRTVLWHPVLRTLLLLGGIRMMLASLPWGLTGISIFHFTFGWPHGGWACVFVCFLFDVPVHGGRCYGTQCYALASLRWLPDLGGLVSMGLNLDTVSFLMF